MSFMEQLTAKKQVSTGPVRQTRRTTERAGRPAKSGFRIDFGPSKKDILNFTNQLAVMVRAGISLQDALDSIGSQIEKEKFRLVVFDLKNRIEGGQSFSHALAEHPEVFSNLVYQYDCRGGNLRLDEFDAPAAG